MAEERILILAVKPFYEDEIAYKDINVNMEDLPSRTEAIERMAKAMCKKIYGKQHNITTYSEKDYFIGMAKAALNALLKGE